MHVLLRILAEGVSNSPTPPDNSVKIAIITAISVVLAAAITGFATINHRKQESGTPPNNQNTNDYIGELLRVTEIAQRHVESLEIRNEWLSRHVDELERICWRNGIDPNTGDVMVPRRQNGARNGDAPTQEAT